MTENSLVEKPSHYVGIGASAGGLEAIESFFKIMPIDSGVAFIVIQHLSPDYKSLMTELLSKRTAMEVYRAEDGMDILPNCVYLIPPRKNLRIFHGKLLLSEQEHHGQSLNLPIDIFFKSLAEDQGDKSIAIVLSGTGSDGTRGVRAIKEVGGMVMVQDEESAKFDGMPRSVIALGLADLILPPEQMPKQLAAYVRQPYALKQDKSDSLASEQDGMTRLYSLLREHSRIDFTYYKPATVLRRIERRMAILQVTDLADYVSYLERHRDEVNTLYRELLIGVTNFFRDHEAFETLYDKYLPEVLSGAEKREIRLWVAGCSTGEEAYTLAILCREVMSDIGVARDVKIFATDVDQSAIETASEGRYPEGIITDVPPKLLSKYFSCLSDGRYQIVRNIREMVVFAQHNLIKDPPFTNIDFISCRNLLIYLQPVLQRKALELFNFSLVSDGIMMLGTSETTGDMGDCFEPLHHKWRIYRSRGRRKTGTLDLGPIGLEHSRSVRSRISNAQSAARLQHEEERVLDRFLQTFADDYVVFSMVVNPEMEVIHAIGDTEGFLRMQPGMISADASKLIARELAIPLATGVQKVLKKGDSLAFTKIRMSSGDDERLLQMRLKLLPTKKGQLPLVGVFVNEMRERPGPELKGSEGVTFDVSREAENRINDLEQELQFTRENLQATVEELETSNEELQATNEELLASNEELQSTNEELQSVNEELYTVNAEYQSKITELTELTNDLDNLLSSTSIGTLFLDEDLEIRRFSTKVTDLLNLIDSDVGRPLKHVSHNVGGVDLVDISNRVLSQGNLHEVQLKATDEIFYMLRALPYRVASEVYAGVVLIFIDITRQKNAEEELKRRELRYHMAQEHARIGTWEWSLKSNELYWSDNIEPMLGLENGAFGGSYDDFLDVIYEEDRDVVKKAISDAVASDGDYRVDHRILLADGSVSWMRESGKLYHDEEGLPNHMVGTVQDITELKAVEIECTRIRSGVPKVLLVDDAPAVRPILETLIKDFPQKLELMAASNGFEGLIMAARHDPILIIADLIMPDMDGFKMLNAMSADPLLAAKPIIVTSGLTDSEIVKYGGLPDGVSIMRKPFDLEMAKSILHESLGKLVEA